MGTIGEGGSEEMRCAALAKVQLLAERGHRDREAADGKVGSSDVLEQAFQVLLAEGTVVENAPTATRKQTTV